MSNSESNSDPDEDFTHAIPPPRKPEFPVNYELQELCERCRKFTASISEYSRIHPLHIALVLLYDGLRDSDDPRLFCATNVVDQSLERPLFWIAISKVRKFTLPKYLDEHIKTTTYEDKTETLQMSIGQAIWNKVQRLRPSDLVAPEVEINEANEAILADCTEAARGIFIKAKALCNIFYENFIGPHHILLALLEDNAIKDILEGSSLDVKALAVVIQNLRKKKVAMKRGPEPRFPLLNQFGTDLTRKVQEKLDQGGQVDPIIGRNQELRRLIAILSRYSKNNAVLLGDPGVGKTTLAEGLALRIVQGEVPESVIAYVFSLDLGALLASTACKSVYEQILEDILKEIADHEDRGINAILFIDELSQITTGGYRGDGVGIDAATLMKPFLSKGKLRCVGCSTFEDFRTSIEKDGALSRQFSSVFVCEPTGAEAIKMLRGLKHGMENFHNVYILDEAFIAAASIAAQFFPNKRLPDSAIGLIDEACVITKIGTDASREHLGRLKRQMIAIELKIQSLKREVDEDSDKMLHQAHSEMQEVEKKIKGLESSARAFRPIRNTVEHLEWEISVQNRLIAEYSRTGQQEEKSKCVKTIFQLEARKLAEETKLKVSQNLINSSLSEKRLVSRKQVVQAARWYRPLHTEPWGRTNNAEIATVFDKLSKVVVAQHTAVTAISGAVRCMIGGLTDPSRPVASFLFGGPPGSGKTLLAKELANSLLGSSEKLLCINGADYTTPHSISRLIGTPACTGFDQGGQLTECVRRKPFSVILIEEIEKACLEFRLQIQTILDEGCLKDGAGKIVDFANCLVIITTSIGQENSRMDDDEHQHFLKAIETSFPVDFLARIDEVIVFRRITAQAMAAIVDARLEEFRQQLSRIKLDLKVEKAVRQYLTITGWSLSSGARQLENVVRLKILRPLASLLLGDVRDDWTVRLGLNDGDFTIDLDQYVEPVSDDTTATSQTVGMAPVNLMDLDEGESGEYSANDCGFYRERVHSQTLVPSTSGPPIPQSLPQRL